MPEDHLSVTTIVSTGLTPEAVEAEAKRIAMRAGGIMLITLSERGLSEQELADQLQVPLRQLRHQILGKAWKAYLPLAAVCLGLGIRMDLRTKD